MAELAGSDMHLQGGQWPPEGKGSVIEIAESVRGAANADLAERLDTDQWQDSRAGRRLRDLGLASRSRAGRLNAWVLTSAGGRAADRLRSR